MRETAAPRTELSECDSLRDSESEQLEACEPAEALLSAFSFERCRSVWVPWVSHAIVDVSVFGIGWVLLFG